MGLEHRQPRCLRCRMLPWHCFCDRIVPVPATTRVVLVMHHREVRKLSNTGRLVDLALTDSTILVHGRPGASVAFDEAGDGRRQTYLLFPTEDARPLDRAEVAADGRPVTLVVPDGTWRQARRMPRRVPGLAGLPRRRLPPGPPSRYRLRSSPHREQIATCEAVARALGVVEGPAVQAALEALFDTQVERLLAAREGR